MGPLWDRNSKKRKERHIQILHPTPTLTTQDTLRQGRPEDPIPRGVCPNASVTFERREAGVRENIEKKVQ